MPTCGYGYVAYRVSWRLGKAQLDTLEVPRIVRVIEPYFSQQARYFHLKRVRVTAETELYVSELSKHTCWTQRFPQEKIGVVAALE